VATRKLRALGRFQADVDALSARQLEGTRRETLVDFASLAEALSEDNPAIVRRTMWVKS